MAVFALLTKKNLGHCATAAGGHLDDTWLRERLDAGRCTNTVVGHVHLCDQIYDSTGRLAMPLQQSHTIGQ